MEAYTFNIKGYAKVSFSEDKQDMTSGKIWKIISAIWRHFPEKLSLGTSVKRGAPDVLPVDDNKTCILVSDMIEGCIDVCDITLAGGKSVNILLGSCYEYTLPFGTMSVDTGHQTMITVLPFPMEGCYSLSGAAEGYFKRSGTKEHYMINISLDIYIGKITPQDIDTYITKGHKVYPMMIRHPEHFPKRGTSDSEMETDDPSDNDKDLGPGLPKGQIRKKKRQLPTKRGILKRRSPALLSMSNIKSSIQEYTQAGKGGSDGKQDTHTGDESDKDTITESHA